MGHARLPIEQQGGAVKYAVQKISFPAQGSTVVGTLFVPQDGRPAHEAVVLIGPVAFVKEQAPLQYATRLARSGYVTLIFDPRYSGESGGEPRRLESGAAKVEDLRAAVDFLLTSADIEATAVHLLAICQGVNWAAKAAAADERFASLTLVAGHYLSRATTEMYSGGPQEADARIARALAAKQTYETTGHVAYLPIVQNELGEAAHLPYPAPLADWYLLWGHRHPLLAYKGRWENRLALMSEAELWTNDVTDDLARLTLPVLMVHSDRAATGPDLPRQFFGLIPGTDKQLVWLEDQFQLQFYEDAVTIDTVTHLVETWLTRV